MKHQENFRYDRDVPLSGNDKREVAAMVKADPTLWPARVAELFGMGVTQAAEYIKQVNAGIRAKSVI